MDYALVSKQTEDSKVFYVATAETSSAFVLNMGTVGLEVIDP